MLLDGHAHDMEIDTGASVSVMSQSMCQQLFGRKKLEKTSIQLKTYINEQLKVMGQLMVQVRHGKEEACLPLVVLEGSGPSLIGRDWLSRLQLDWQAIHRLQERPLSEVLDKHKAVFEEGLGTLKGFEAELQVDPNAQPKYCKARFVPYSMKVLEEEELDLLDKEGTIEPIAFSEWAAPIVPVLKRDKKSVRICGDFKLTVNKAARLDRYPIPKVEDLFAELAGGQAFTKRDLSQAYEQIRLSEESKKYVVINTSKGLFRYTAVWKILGTRNIPTDHGVLAARHPTGDGLPGRHIDFGRPGKHTWLHLMKFYAGWRKQGCASKRRSAYSWFRKWFTWATRLIQRVCTQWQTKWMLFRQHQRPRI